MVRCRSRCGTSTLGFVTDDRQVQQVLGRVVLEMERTAVGRRARHVGYAASEDGGIVVTVVDGLHAWEVAAALLGLTDAAVGVGQSTEFRATLVVDGVAVVVIAQDSVGEDVVCRREDPRDTPTWRWPRPLQEQGQATDIVLWTREKEQPVDLEADDELVATVVRVPARAVNADGHDIRPVEGGLLVAVVADQLPRLPTSLLGDVYNQRDFVNVLLRCHEDIGEYTVEQADRWAQEVLQTRRYCCPAVLWPGTCVVYLTTGWRVEASLPAGMDGSTASMVPAVLVDAAGARTVLPGSPPPTSVALRRFSHPVIHRIHTDARHFTPGVAFRDVGRTYPA